MLLHALQGFFFFYVDLLYVTMCVVVLDKLTSCHTFHLGRFVANFYLLIISKLFLNVLTHVLKF